MTTRLFAIGDIHGSNQQLIALLSNIKPQSNDTLIFLGDLIDRGDDSKGVLDTILNYQSLCQVVLIQGNHEQVMLLALEDPCCFES